MSKSNSKDIGQHKRMAMGETPNGYAKGGSVPKAPPFPPAAPPKGKAKGKAPGC